MMIMKVSVVISLLVLAVTPCLEGSLLQFLDRSSSNSLGEVWQDRFPDPFRVLEQIPFGFEKGDMAVSLGSVDWKETPDAHVIMLDVPGFQKEDLKIEVEENRILRVSGERKKEEEKRGDHWHREERSYGKFWRQFRLPDNVDLDSVRAKLENGVLTICFKKLSPDQIKGPKVVSIAAEEMKEKLMEGGSAKQEL